MPDDFDFFPAATSDDPHLHLMPPRSTRLFVFSHRDKEVLGLDWSDGNFHGRLYRKLLCTVAAVGAVAGGSAAVLVELVR